MMVFGFHEIDKTKFALVGGKGSNLGELSKIEGINVPDGFCISTEVFKRIVEHSGTDRKAIGNATIPQDIVKEIDRFLKIYGENIPYAVRSSATAEDLPTASFAGQQDTFLNVIGRDSILTHIRKCWASLYTDRAIAYRAQNGFDDDKVYLSVVIQKMVFPQVAGIMFTADPVTSNRKIVSIDASFGLGEAMVSGKVNADVYKVRDGHIVDKKISAKKVAIYPVKNGGTKEEVIDPSDQNTQALTDEQILELARIGRKIERHFGSPQDIEWCLVDGIFYIVQSRPITTLFPIPETNDDANHVYLSVGHQQMMTDAMRPLGLSVRQLTGNGRMYIAGGRMFVDVASSLASMATRDMMLELFGKGDPLIKDALVTILDRGDFIKSIPGDKTPPPPNFQALNEYGQDDVAELVSQLEKDLEELKQDIRSKTGSGLIDFLFDDLHKLRKSLTEPKSFGVIMTSMNAAFWLNDKMKEWLGEKNVADTLTLSVPNNVTSEMGLALLEVADVIRIYPGVVDYLQKTTDDDFLEKLANLHGGSESRKAMVNFLDKYGMRCAGEIDITKPRWSERPLTLVPAILSCIRNLEPNESARKFEQGKEEASKKEKELLGRLKELPGGEEKAKETKKMIDLVRNLAGYREYPKYALVARYFVYKKALLEEAERLVKRGELRQAEDIFYLTLEELRAGEFDHMMIEKRREQFIHFEKLMPPRVMTSDGEIVMGKYRRDDLPANAIIGLAVSSGLVEGRARVILKIEDADLEEGDILVTTFTDPSWTPLFVSIKGLVTEVGGLMTHGAVIAREYGLPAVVGIDNATKMIKDGDRIRVNGTEGYVEVIG
ncbi:MAG TPA: phosphoenolpyruvate synthase [Cyclobacteriaceae bacterium]|nr:phosphoenolpyruvate synthase [Cyclobacteriaceae bacterium]